MQINISNLRHNSGLSARIDKGLDGYAVDLAVDVEHDDRAEALGVVFHR